MTQRSAGKDAPLLDDRRRPRDPGDGLQDFPRRLLEVAHRLNGAGLLVVPFLTACRKLIPDQSYSLRFQFFSLLDDRDLDVRTVAEESINRVINALRDSHSGRLQVDAHVTCEVERAKECAYLY